MNISHATIKSNLNAVQINDKVVYFSYSTPIGVFDTINLLMMLTCRNYSRTTASHLKTLKDLAENNNLQIVYSNGLVLQDIDI